MAVGSRSCTLSGNSHLLCRQCAQKYNTFSLNNTVYSLTYLITPCCRVLLEQLTGLQLVEIFPAFHGTRRFITALTSVRHLSLSWASPIQSIYPHPTSWRYSLILSTHLRLGLPSGLFPSGFPSKTLYTPLSSPIRATCPAHLILTKNKSKFIIYISQKQSVEIRIIDLIKCKDKGKIHPGYEGSDRL